MKGNVKTTHKVSVKKSVSKDTDSVNFVITVDGKELEMSVNVASDYVLIHHTTGFTDFTFCSTKHDVKIKELNSDGSVYSIGFNAKI